MLCRFTAISATEYTTIFTQLFRQVGRANGVKAQRTAPEAVARRPGSGEASLVL